MSSVMLAKMLFYWLLSFRKILLSDWIRELELFDFNASFRLLSNLFLETFIDEKFQGWYLQWKKVSLLATVDRGMASNHIHSLSLRRSAYNSTSVYFYFCKCVWRVQTGDCEIPRSDTFVRLTLEQGNQFESIKTKLSLEGSIHLDLHLQ